VLAAFAGGRLSGPDTERVAEHLGVCLACLAALRAVPEDTLSLRLRGCRDEPEDPELARMQEYACRLVPRPGEATVAADETPVRVPVRGGDTAAGEFGPYELLGEPIAGGMGVVWKARHRVLNVPRALKMLPADGDDPEAVTRFCVEGEATARLDHPGIVRVHEFGEHAGRLYYAMEFLDGGTLAQRLKGGPLPPREAAELLAGLARAVHYAHGRKVIHRDLKPSNVLFTAGGTAKIADFGLAKMIDEASVAGTRTDAALGTPAYMSPEQAAGRAREATPAMDVWGLGVLLYECLTGKGAFKGRSRQETLERVLRGQPQPPSRLRPEVDAELEAVCLKCIEKEPARRYPSAGALADNLERWLRGEPTWPPPVGPLGRLWQAVRRRRGRVAAALAAVLLVAVAVLAWRLADPDRAERRIEDRLAGGEAVELVPAKGDPAWCEWVIGKPKGSFFRSEADGTFSLSSGGVSCLELVRDPRLSRYRFRAEVRHWQGPRLSRAGLYFVRGGTRASGYSVSWFYDLAFNDTEDLAKARDASVARDKPRNPPRHRGNDLSLEPWLLGEKADGRFSPSVGGPALCYFEPNSAAWRHLAVDVTPERIRLWWQGEVVGEVTADGMVRDADELVSRLRQSPLRDLCSELPPVVFSPRQSLGLEVRFGAASFRNVAVEPLDTAP
jgi:serine/threonine-protein kinase